ncbi:MAG: protein of unknown function (DUF4194) [Glomeribacter sp. 1016415]|nr:protein of unknown function (DUF4194) [Glomeribacter sp. 1016415]
MKMDDNRLPPLLIALLQGVLYRDIDLARWQALLDLQARVRDYYVIIGLELIVDEAEGYAYLRQRPTVEGASELPRLLPRRPLSYPVSLILVLLRKKMAEFDVTSSDSRLVMSREEIVELIRLFLPDTVNEVKLLNRIDTHINKIIELGFLRRLAGQDQQFEVHRILKAFVDAQWLNEFEQRLTDYCNHAQTTLESENAS